METLPNPGLEGYRTAHEQNKDGSYKHTVTSADLICHRPGCSIRTTGSTNKLKREEPIVVHHVLVADLFAECTGRVISKKMEEIYRLRHHDFKGLSGEETARRTGMTQDTIRRLMWRMCKMAPQLFPILTPAQARAWHLWHHEGMSHSMIAEVMGISTNAAQKRVAKAKVRLDYHKALKLRLVVMDPRKLEQLEIEEIF